MSNTNEVLIDFNDESLMTDKIKVEVIYLKIN